MEALGPRRSIVLIGASYRMASAEWMEYEEVDVGFS